MNMITPIRPIDLPHSLQAEQVVLGAMLIKKTMIDQITDICSGEDFFEPAHEKIFNTICRYHLAGKHPTPITLKPVFHDDPALASVGGGLYLGELAGSVLSLLAVPDYAAVIRDLAIKRRIIAAAQEAISRASRFAGEEDAAAIANDLSGAIGRVLNDGASYHQKSIGDFLDEALRASETAAKGIRPRAVPTGMREIDDIAMIEPGMLLVLAARPKMGKSALAGNLATAAATAGYPCLFISQEMTGVDLSQRMIAGETGVSVQRQKRGTDLTPSDWEEMTAAAAQLRQTLITINDSGSMSLAQIQTAARRWHRVQQERDGWRPGMIIIDHLGRIDKPNQRQSDYEAVSENVKGLKSLAKDLNVPVILLAQLSRKVETRDDKRPMLADLRDSGRIEEEADGIWLLYREAYYLQMHEPARRLGEADDKFNDRAAQHYARLDQVRYDADVIIAKNRQGEEGTVTLQWNGVRQKFIPRDKL